MIRSFNPIKSRRPWPPISISHLFQQGPFSSWPLLFTPGVFLFRYYSIITVLIKCSLFPLSKCVMITQLLHTVVVPLIITLPSKNM